MNSASFRGIHEKLARGKEQADLLKEELIGKNKEWSDQPGAFDAWIEIDRDLPADTPEAVRAIHGVRCATAGASRIPRTSDLRHGVILGDVLHNYRAALDHLAWVLARRNRPYLKATAARRVQFPLATSAASFRKQHWRIPGASPTEWALIESYQPYKRTNRGRVMRTLRNLSDTDKHRVVIPTFATFYGSDAEVKVRGNYRVVWHRPLVDVGKTLKRGAPIAQAFFVGSDSPDSQVGVVGSFSFVPSLPGGLPLENFLSALDETCNEIVGWWEI